MKLIAILNTTVTCFWVHKSFRFREQHSGYQNTISPDSNVRIIETLLFLSQLRPKRPKLHK
jgi:hypothetical protein